MKVLHIQYRMPPSGNACFRLHTAMRKNGIDSSVLNIENSVNRNRVYGLPIGPKWFLKKCLNQIQRRLVERQLKTDGLYYNPLPWVGASLTNNELVKKADVIYFHWIAGCISHEEIERITKTGKPIIFFMHDMWDITGGCHYSFECHEYRNGCEKCQMLRTKLSSEYARNKKKLYSKSNNIIFISPSDWLRECASESSVIFGKKIFTVNNIIDETVFRPLDKSMVRKLLNLPLSKRIITFGCQGGIVNSIKGWHYLHKAIDLLNYDDVEILVYGSDYQKEIQNQIKYPIRFLGPVFDETKLSLICNATDVFVSPSLSESYGLTLMENILCGTPVVAFDNTAIGEIVKTGINGYLSKNKDPEDLAKGIKYVLENNLKNILDNGYSSDALVRQHMDILRKEFGLVP